jgi:hypothetical protein
MRKGFICGSDEDEHCEERIRIVSARKVTPDEAAGYYAQFQPRG